MLTGTAGIILYFQSIHYPQLYPYAICRMSGSDCVAIACDLRLGVNNFTTVSTNFTKIFKINNHVYVGLTGLATDIQTLYELLRYRVNLYQIRQETEMDIDCFANMLSSILYANRFSPYFVNPIVVGFKIKNSIDGNGNKSCTYEPYLTAYDFIGAKCETNDFVVNGVTSEQLYGMCESLYIKDQDEQGLFETISQCLLSALDRDCISGWGAEVYVLTPDKITKKKLKARMD
ncbi:proteasome subunit beta type-3, putative [Plasmodium ovale curtisi]|uniref:Proteasome subunit beta type-3, putative n=1 Tax=Plasmodium ovale curtisi TaxID=864141 RepID=A0A1A8VLB6_PLAOA|nr:proteasome subunit beta type-3, putative [Plasmodium ovale curtisi]